MEDQKLILTRSRLSSTEHASLGYIDVYPQEGDGGPQVLISVIPDDYDEESQKYILRTGDTFPVKDQVWRVLAIRDLSSPEDRQHEWAILVGRDS